MSTELSASTASDDALTNPLRPIERVAVVLALLEPDQARLVASHLDDGAADRVIAAYEGMRSVDKRAVLRVIADFVTEMESGGPRVRGGPSQAAKLAEAINDDPFALDLPTMDELPTFDDIAATDDADSFWTHLNSLSAEVCISVLSKQRPSVIAAVLRKLDNALAARILSKLDKDKAIAVTAQMAKGKQVPRESLEAIAESLKLTVDKIDTDTTVADDFDPIPKLTNILNRCPSSRQKAVLEPLEAIDADIAKEVEKKLLRFETLVEMMPRSAVPMLFREMEEGKLHDAIRFGSENATDTVEFLYANISQRLAQQIREKINVQPMPEAAAGEAAQAEVIAQILEWVEEDRFALNFL